MKAFASGMAHKGKPRATYTPVYVALGMISFAVVLGLHTAKQQFMHAPAVRVKKSRRETVPEVVEPDRVAQESENFINKSLFRKGRPSGISKECRGRPNDSRRRCATANLKGIRPAFKNVRNLATIAETSPKLESQTTNRLKKSLKEELLPKGKPLRDYVPVYVALGMITLSLSLGLYTAKQELLHGPDVRVKKTRRETLPEVVEPDTVAREAEDFVKKSLFRKVAHVQEFETTLPNPVRGHLLSKELKVESLKTVGIDPLQVGP
ncbi:hypothetical protein KSS87_004345 [Heliosperma pusillum]|nr:hypothetical protein KSS87_004345 [Heliosperma pusillum]